MILEVVGMASIGSRSIMGRLKELANIVSILKFQIMLFNQVDIF